LSKDERNAKLKKNLMMGMALGAPMGLAGKSIGSLLASTPEFSPGAASAVYSMPRKLVSMVGSPLGAIALGGGNWLQDQARYLGAPNSKGSPRSVFDVLGADSGKAPGGILEGREAASNINKLLTKVRRTASSWGGNVNSLTSAGLRDIRDLIHVPDNARENRLAKPIRELLEGKNNNSLSQFLQPHAATGAADSLAERLSAPGANVNSVVGDMISDNTNVALGNHGTMTPASGFFGFGQRLQNWMGGLRNANRTNLGLPEASMGQKFKDLGKVVGGPELLKKMLPALRSEGSVVNPTLKQLVRAKTLPAAYSKGGNFLSRSLLGPAVLAGSAAGLDRFVMPAVDSLVGGKTYRDYLKSRFPEIGGAQP
jgi:hypothetical protein